jgi:hypothetical protein
MDAWFAIARKRCHCPESIMPFLVQFWGPADILLIPLLLRFTRSSTKPLKKSEKDTSSNSRTND